MPARSLRLPAQVAQTTSPSTPITGEKLAEIAQQAKDSSGSNIYLGRELAKADVKFGTWGLDAGGLRQETKKEEQQLTQFGEVRDGVTAVGQGFNLMGPKEAPPAPSGVSVAPRTVPLFGDLPMLGSAFKDAEVKAGLTKSPNELLPIPGTNSIEAFGALIAGAPVANPSGYVNGNGQWQFTTGTGNLEWARAGETNELLAGIPAVASSFSNKLVAAGSNTASYDRYTFYRNLEQLGAEGDKQRVTNVYSLNAVGFNNASARSTNPTSPEELIPPGTIDFRGADLNQALELYGHLTGRSVMRSDNLPSPIFLLDAKQPMTKSQAIRALDMAFAANGIAIVDVGDKFAKAAPSAASGQMGAPSRESELSANRLNNREMVTHVIQVDTNVFRQEVQSIKGLVVGGFTTSGPSDSGVRAVTRTNEMATLQADVRKLFETAGAHFGPQESVYYDERDGTLVVRTTPQNAEIIRDATAVLNQPAPAVDVAAKFSDTSADKPDRGNGGAVTRDDMAALQQKFADQKAKIDKAQSDVDRLREQYNISDAMAAADAPTILMSAVELRKLEGMRIELEAQVMREETLLDSLKKMPREKLAYSLPTAAPDAVLTSLAEQKNLAEQALIVKQSELGEANPEVARLRDQVSDLRSKIDKQTDGILLNLDGRVATVREQLSKLTTEVEKAKTNDIASAQKAAPYWEAKRELDSLQRFSAVLASKIAAENVEVSLPKSTMGEIMD
jgi:hypothetical protein